MPFITVCLLLIIVLIIHASYSVSPSSWLSRPHWRNIRSLCGVGSRNENSSKMNSPSRSGTLRKTAKFRSLRSERRHRASSKADAPWRCATFCPLVFSQGCAAAAQAKEPPSGKHKVTLPPICSRVARAEQRAQSEAVKVCKRPTAPQPTLLHVEVTARSYQSQEYRRYFPNHFNNRFR